jgi:hypothetical protein
LAMKYFKAAADQGHPQAQVLYAYYSTDPKEALRYYQMAAIQGHVLALYKVAMERLQDGDTEQALPKLRKAAEWGGEAEKGWMGEEVRHYPYGYPPAQLQLSRYELMQGGDDVTGIQYLSNKLGIAQDNRVYCYLPLLYEVIGLLYEESLKSLTQKETLYSAIWTFAEEYFGEISPQEQQPAPVPQREWSQEAKAYLAREGGRYFLWLHKGAHIPEMRFQCALFFLAAGKLEKAVAWLKQAALDDFSPAQRLLSQMKVDYNLRDIHWTEKTLHEFDKMFLPNFLQRIPTTLLEGQDHSTTKTNEFKKWIESGGIGTVLAQLPKDLVPLVNHYLPLSISDQLTRDISKFKWSDPDPWEEELIFQNWIDEDQSRIGWTDCFESPDYFDTMKYTLVSWDNHGFQADEPVAIQSTFDSPITQKRECKL